MNDFYKLHFKTTWLGFFLIVIPLHAGAIFIDQVGYLPGQPKIAYIAQKADSFYLIQSSDGRIVHRGAVQFKIAADPATGMDLYQADFSDWRQAGRFFIRAPGIGDSYAFEIGDSVYDDTYIKSLKAFYFQRCGAMLSPAFAGLYGHPACHQNDAYFHPSTGISGTKSAVGGWHDAGDYGKYVVNAGITVETLLMAYEYFPQSFACDHAGIPESDNGVPDILDEVRYELTYLLKMQEGGGGVFHKLTREQFSGFIMPQMDKEKRYLYAVSTAATADFAAMMARASRVFRAFDAVFADSCLAAAEKAWQFLQAHPSILPPGGFSNPGGTGTGAYGDDQDTDERLLAAVELFESAGEDAYHNHFLANYEKPGLFSRAMAWPQVAPLAHITYLYSIQSKAQSAVKATLQAALLSFAQRMMTEHGQSGFSALLKPGEYVWGCNSDALNKAILLLFVYEKSAQPSYLQAALDQLHYVLGANAHNICFVTGLGSWSPRNIHHRPSAADGVQAPVPGLLAGGPNQNLQDAVLRSKFNNQTPPALCYVDHVDSYAGNEICINWNAPLVFLAGYFADSSISHIEETGDAGAVPGSIHILPNYPNPFRDSTVFIFSIKKAQNVRLHVFNIKGELVYDAELGYLSPGEKTLSWHPVDPSGKRLCAGAYFLQLDGSLGQKTHKFVIL
ncbi:glycoside hydrolase family 9 protein [candidate division KSB1 bacterium]|nr:glycoside hydrolase family 9 protein [candidate division KSB1 bacterium]